eukprot:8336470-Pyramimonas_sp.AAC.1
MPEAGATGMRSLDTSGGFQKRSNREVQTTKRDEHDMPMPALGLRRLGLLRRGAFKHNLADVYVKL